MLLEHIKRGDLDDEQAVSLARDLVVLVFAHAILSNSNRTSLIRPSSVIHDATLMADAYLEEPSK